MFVLSENKLKGLIAPITPFYGTQSEWMRLEEGELTTFSDIYRSQPAVRSVVDFIAGHAARMPIKLFRQEGGGTGDSDSGDREHLRNHPLQKLLNVPNGHKRVGRSSFWNDVWKDFLIYDRVCLVKIKDIETGDPVALVRVPPVWFSPAGENYWWPESIRIIGNRGSEDIPIGNVVYIHGYDPVDPRIGVSPMQTLKAVLQEEAKSVSWRNRFWDQGVQPTMVVSRPIDAGDWDDDARDRFIESLRAAASRGKPLLLEEGMTTNPAASFNPQSAEYLKGKQFTREEVLRVYNLPVGLFEQGTSSNIAQYRAMLYAETLAPILGRFVDELESQLLTEWSIDPYDDGLYLEPAIEEKMRGNIMEQVSTVAAATGGPFMLRSEGRTLLNLPSLPDDPAKPDKLILPSGVVVDGEPAGGKPDPPQFGGGFGGGFGGPPPGLPPQFDPNGSVPLNPANQNGPAQPPTENDAATRADTGGAQRRGAATRTKAYQAPAAAKARFQRETSSILKKHADRQAQVIRSSGGKFAIDRWNKELGDDLFKQRQRITEYFGTRAADEWGVDFDASRTEEYNRIGAERQASFINELTKANLETYHTTSETASELDKLLDGLAGRFEEASKDTVTHLSSFGAYAAASQAGRIAKKVWMTLSGNPRPSHAAIDGEERGLDETFSNGLRYPHDPAGDVDEVAGCQCEVAFDVSDEPLE